MHKGSLGVAIVSVLLAGNAMAEESAPAAPAAAPAAPAAAPAAGGPKYGAAGCGLGSMVFGNKPGIVQVLAATTNGTSASQTFGITSGTSNCDSGSGGTASTKVFVAANRDALVKDIARGSGETIKNVALLNGCADAKAVGVALQKNFKSIFPSSSVSSDGMADAITGTLSSDASLKCTKLSA